jgi:hypothetical protein
MRTIALCLGIMLAATVSCGITLVAQSHQQRPTYEELRVVAAPGASEDEFADVPRTGEHHEELRLVTDIAGVNQPEFSNARSTSLRESDEVIGVVVSGKAFAFSREAMNHPIRHIINLNIDDTPVSVTYCGMVDTARVLTGPTGPSPIPLRVGGQDIHYQLVYLLEGTRYGQSSPDLPLQDYPFERTTLESWLARYPDTRIYEEMSVPE